MRLDSALVVRGLVDSRTKAQRRIRAGDVRVDGVVITKASQEVAHGVAIDLTGEHDFVGRGALKLRAALDQWDISTSNAVALDIGSSTGGFTQVLLENGARRVIALDVGHNQLHPLVRDDSRVHSVEGFNVREISSEWWGDEVGEDPHLIVCDVSFISLSHIFEPVVKAVGPCDWIVLVKPQFEVGRTGVKGGIVLESHLRAEAITSVLESAAQSGLRARELMRSPITGEAGNVEYLCWLSPTHGRNPPQWSQEIHELAHS